MGLYKIAVLLLNVLGILRGPETPVTTLEKDLVRTNICGPDECAEKCQSYEKPWNCNRGSGGECLCASSPEERLDAERSCFPELCVLACSSRGEIGQCVSNRCKCRQSAPEEPSTEATECTLERCSHVCSSRRLEGECVDGQCNCRQPQRSVNQREELMAEDAIGCPDESKCVNFCVRWMKRGFCENNTCICF